MRTTDGAVGPRGIALLLVTAVAGIALGTHGWLVRQSGVAPGALAATSSAAGGSSGAPGPGASPGPRRPPAGSSTRGGHGRGSAASVGPTLRSQSFAPYAFLVWPGPPNAAAKAAMTGLSIAVRRTGAGISVKAGVTSQPQAPARTYQGGARVYVVEASMGDEAANTDYNLGDDGVVVTDGQGRILQ